MEYFKNLMFEKIEYLQSKESLIKNFTNIIGLDTTNLHILFSKFPIKAMYLLS